MEMSCESVRVYSIPVASDGTLADRPDQEIDRLVRLKMRTNGVDYETAFSQVRRDPDCAAALRKYAAS